MEISPEQRQAICDYCLPMSWQLLAAWRLRHLGSLNDEADVVVDWLRGANQRHQALVHEIVRFMSARHWRIELPAVAAKVVGASHNLQHFDVVCGGQRWTLWLQGRPYPRLLRLSR